MSKTAYPNTTTPVSITLYCNVPFDNAYKHHSMISSYFKKQSGATQPSIFPNGEQESFLNRKYNSNYVYPRWTMSDTFNFDFKNGLMGSITLELTNAQTNANYLKVVSGSQKWFYFITSIMQSNLDTYTLTLELDVLMTYGDEFLQGMKDIPVFTKRKHCRRYKGSYVYSQDYKTGDSAFNNVKPNLVKGVYSLTPEYRSDTSGTDTTNPVLKDVLWAYVVCDIVDDETTTPAQVGKYQYALNDCWNPFSVICFPINRTMRIFVTSSGGVERSYRIGGMNTFRQLISQEHFKSAKILPYPPFHKLSSNLVISYGGDNHEYIDFWGLSTETTTETYKFNGTNGVMAYMSSGAGYLLYFGDNLIGHANENSLMANVLVIGAQKNISYDYKLMQPYNLAKPTLSILSSKVDDPKLLLKPFCKYVLSSSGSDELEFYVEILVSTMDIEGDYNLKFTSITTAYAGDYSIFTYINTGATTPFQNYKWGKVGLANTPNYTYPVGSEALEVFKNTQSQTYYQSKIASGITSDLTIAGVAMAGIGIAGAVGTMGMSTPVSVGMIATGVGAVASGTAGMVDTIKSTNAKIEDLKNTPDSINISGASYGHDIAMNVNGLLPYVIVYQCSPVIRESANNYFYSIGYEISRPCYFNQLVNQSSGDNDLFDRTIFNYIQIEDDITTKINADIPYLVKQKLSSIFNNGITLWTFFGFSSLNSGASESATYKLDKWLFKNTLENKEYEGESYE